MVSAGTSSALHRQERDTGGFGGHSVSRNSPDDRHQSAINQRIIFVDIFTGNDVDVRAMLPEIARIVN
ncbi:hypothetical protein L681_04725 [Stenotrophomonas maltophilia MF89]|nr:hypothetical protein L681_04725 [Stenotrophomonas maltophilia MF89]